MKSGIVIFAFESQPTEFFTKAAKLCGKDAVFDPDVARMAGANFAIGLPEHLQHMRSKLQAQAIADCKNDSLPEGAAMWLACGSRGISSNTIFQTLTGIDALLGWEPSHPHDPDDLDSCLRLLEAVPSFKARMKEMEPVSKQWAALVARWDEIVQCHIDEVGIGWTKANSAPRTFALMREILDGVK